MSQARLTLPVWITFKQNMDEGVEEWDLERRAGPLSDDPCDPTREQSTVYPDSTGTPGGVSVCSRSESSDQSHSVAASRLANAHEAAGIPDSRKGPASTVRTDSDLCPYCSKALTAHATGRTKHMKKCQAASKGSRKKQCSYPNCDGQGSVLDGYVSRPKPPCSPESCSYCTVPEK